MAKKQASQASQTGLRESFSSAKKADWNRADAEQLLSTLATVAKAGGALRLGYSRDGGAYAIGVYGDGDPYTLYIPPTDSIDDVLVKIENAFGELT